MMQTKPTVTIIGKGAVGSALSGFFTENGYQIISEWTSRSGRIVHDRTKEPVLVERNHPESSEEMGDLIFITTPDDEISVVAGKLAGLPITWGEKSVVHTSGNITSSVLNPLKEKGASVASMHPIQTFRKGDGPSRFEQIFVSLQGDQNLCQFLEKMAGEMKARSVFLNPKQKSLLHIAAVFSSNYVTALMHKLEMFLNDAGIEEGINVLEPLVKQTINNIYEKGAADSLTGPISRGDFESVKKHLDSIKHDPSLRELYKKLGREALQITINHQKVSEKKLERLKALLDN